jgi:hypothetical protein
MIEWLMAFTRRYWKALVALAVLGWIIWFVGQGLTMEAQVAKRKDRFRRALQEKNVSRALAMVSLDYRDQWNFSHDDLGRVFKDITTQFLSVQIEFTDERIERRGRDVIYTARARLDGQPLTPVGAMMTSYSAQNRDPFVFTWTKEGWWPWSWRLIQIENASLELPTDYQPGMFSENQKSLGDLLDEATSPQAPPARAHKPER